MKNSFVFFFLLLLTLPVIAVAQANININNANGIIPYSTYHGQREDVNLASGNLNLSIPLLHLPGRAGHDVTIVAHLDNRSISLDYWEDSFGTENWTWMWNAQGFLSISLPKLAWSPYSVPDVPAIVKCAGNFVFTDQDGTKHSFENRVGCKRLEIDEQQQCPEPCGTWVPAPQYDQSTFTAEDQSYLTLITSNPADFVLKTKSGTALKFVPPFTVSNEFAQETWITSSVDRNGNQITYAKSPTSNTWTVTDTVGRVITVTPISVQYKDTNGDDRAITITSTANGASTCTFTPRPNHYQTTVSTGLITQTVNLPAGLTYLLEFNNCYELTKIRYPGGGYTRYTYGVFPHLLVVPGVTALRTTTADLRQVSSASTCDSPTGSCSTEKTTTYAPVTNGYANNQFTEVRDPDGNRTRYEFNINITSWNPRKPYYSPRELNRWIYQGESSLLRSIQTEYDDLYTLRARPTRVTTDIGYGNITKTEYAYFGTTDLVTELKEYHYGATAPGALARRTVTDWLTVNPVNSIDYLAAGLHIFGLKSAERVYDAAGALASHATFEYDNYTENLTAAGAIQRASGYGTAFTTRGNLTATSRWRDTDGAWITTRHQYSDAGNIRKTVDPLSHQTLYAFNDLWEQSTCAAGNSQAYATEVTNHLGHRSRTSYHSCSGLMGSMADENDILASRWGSTTSYDALNRKTIAGLADGGQTDFAYPNANTVVSTQKVTTSQNRVDYVYSDGLSRLIQLRTVDPQGDVYTDITYDDSGRKKTVSNPYRSTSEPTYGRVEYQYDALGRVLRQWHQDGNYRDTRYYGNETVTYNEKGEITHQHFTDALGSLYRVRERKDASTVYETFYHYDVLGNLSCVEQRGTGTGSSICAITNESADEGSAWRIRRFRYNSLGQLTRAKNPESGVITYAFDNDGNVVSKTDGRSVTTTFAYDNLHRLTDKTYNDGTPNASFAYDSSSIWGATVENPIGRAVLASGNQGNYGTITSYDAMGRPKKQWHCWSGESCGIVENSYELNGAPKLLIYPNGRRIEHHYGSGSSITGELRELREVNGSGQVLKTYASALTYHPHGALLAATFANNAIGAARSFNNRLQPWKWDSRKNSTQVKFFDVEWDFTDPQNKNLGNVLTYLDYQTLKHVDYTYDQLNRIATAATQNSDWGNVYTVDAWSNMTVVQMAGKANGENMPVAGDYRNQLASLTYDLAGNVTNDGSRNYSFDGEGRLKSMDTGGAAYSYANDGRRIRKLVGATITVYHYAAGGKVLSEYVNGAWSKDYVYLNGELLATESATQSTRYHFADHLGTPRVITDAYANVLSRHDYYPYGKEITAWSDGETHKFTGQERDAESGLDYFIARHYSSDLGRFMQPDEFTGGPVLAWSANDPAPPGPLPYADIANPQSLNKYAYTYNNPVLYTDPDGHCPVKVVCEAIEVVAQNSQVVARALSGIAAATAAADAAVVAGAVGAGISGAGIGLVVNLAINAHADRVTAEANLQMEEEKAANDVKRKQAEAQAGGAGARKGTGKRPHGNTAGNQMADRYERYDAQGNFQKHGVSQDHSRRYSKKELAGGTTVRVKRGPRRKMLREERHEVETNPGPMNKEPWAGKKNGQGK